MYWSSGTIQKVYTAPVACGGSGGSTRLQLRLLANHPHQVNDNARTRAGSAAGVTHQRHGVVAVEVYRATAGNHGGSGNGRMAYTEPIGRVANNRQRCLATGYHECSAAV